MFFKFYLLLFSLTTFIFIDHGQTLVIEPIRGGYEVPHCKVLYQVAIQDRSGSFCSGAIIDKNFIVTAAHCVVGDNCQVNAKELSILAGTSDLNDLDENTQTIDVKRVYLHSRYNPIDLTADIAILELKYPMEIGINWCTGVLKLPNNPMSMYENYSAILTGFGYQNASIETVEGQVKVIGDFRSGKMRYVKTTIMSNKDCQNVYPEKICKSFFSKKKKLLKIRPSFICAFADQNESGQCDGDNGSPLVVDGNRLVGIASRGRADCNDKTRPSIYTRVSSFIDFIKTVLISGNNCQKTPNKYYKICNIPEDKDNDVVKFFIGEPERVCKYRNTFNILMNSK